jgi:hypothetical protein
MTFSSDYLYYYNKAETTEIMYNYGLNRIPSHRHRIIEDTELENHSIYLIGFNDLYDIDNRVPSHILTRLSELENTHLYAKYDFFINVNATIDNIYKLIINYKIKSNNIWIVVAYEFQKQEIEKQLFKLGITPINIIAVDPYLNQIYSQVINHNIKPEISFKTLLPKRFSAFSRRYEYWRFKFFCDLIENNLLDKFYYTFTNGHPESVPYPHEIITKEQLKNLDNVKQISKNKEDIHTWIDNMPYCLDLLEQSNSFPLTIYELYKKSHINIVLETSPFNAFTGIIITEKTYRAISMARPFILFTSNTGLTLLKNLGYETFEPVIDESYSKVDQSIESKCKAIVKETMRLASMSDTEFYNVTQNLQEIANYNFKNFMRLGSKNMLTNMMTITGPKLWNSIL